jgi:hypothetical protein
MGPYYQAWPDGRSLKLHADDAGRNHDEIARFSKRDADAMPRTSPLSPATRGQPWTRSPVWRRNCCTPAARHAAAASASTTSDQRTLAAQPRITSVRIASIA